MTPDERAEYATREFIEGRAEVDFDRRGAIVNQDGEIIGNAYEDLPDEILASGL